MATRQTTSSRFEASATSSRSDVEPPSHLWTTLRSAILWKSYILTFCLVGVAFLIPGWPGALIAQRVMRHKTRKASYRVGIWMAVAVNCASLGWLIARQ